MRSFSRALLSPGAKNRFLADFVPFARRIAELGAWTSLSQALIKLTAPGAADLYQGTELWDLSLVDPDNRRPVDYALRDALLCALDEAEERDRAALIAELAARPLDARAKLFVVSRALRYRREHRGLFGRGTYEPLVVRGKCAENVFAFARREGARLALVVVPRFVARLTASRAGAPLGTATWEDTAVVLHEGRRFTNVFTGESSLARSDGAPRTLEVADVLRSFPVALLEVA